MFLLNVCVNKYQYTKIILLIALYHIIKVRNMYENSLFIVTNKRFANIAMINLFRGQLLRTRRNIYLMHKLNLCIDN